MGRNREARPDLLKTYLVLRPIAMGGRVEAGSRVQMKESEAGNYPPDFLQEVKAEEVSAPVKTDGGGAGSQTDGVGEGSSTGNAGNQMGTEPKTVDHVVTQDDLDNDPALAATGVTVGQTIQIPEV